MSPIIWLLLQSLKFPHYIQFSLLIPLCIEGVPFGYQQMVTSANLCTSYNLYGCEIPPYSSSAYKIIYYFLWQVYEERRNLQWPCYFHFQCGIQWFITIYISGVFPPWIPNTPWVFLWSLPDLALKSSIAITSLLLVLLFLVTLSKSAEKWYLSRISPFSFVAYI